MQVRQRIQARRAHHGSHPGVAAAGVAVLGALALVPACGSVDTTAVGSRANPAVAGLSAPTARQARVASTDWPSYEGGAARTGLSPSTPAPTRLRRGWSVVLDGAVYAQPVAVGGEVIVATENDTVYAFARNSGRRLWAHHLASPVPGNLLPCGDIGNSGITGTPVASASAGRVWAVTFDRSGSRLSHVLWGLSLANGRIVTHQGVDGPGSDPASEQERGALELVGHRVYVPYGGLAGDCSDYHGWVVGAPTSGRGPLATYVTPTQREAGIWAPGGVVSSGSRIYVATGNGSPATSIDNANSVIRLALTPGSRPRLAMRSTFTPTNYQQLSASDTDLGSTTPVLLPANRLFMIGKDGVGYVLGANHLGGLGHPLASAKVCGGGFGASAVSGTNVVVSCFDGLYAVRVQGGGGHPTTLRTLWSASGQPGPPVIAGGVVWSVTRSGSDSGHLLGYDLRTGRLRYQLATAPVVTSFPGLSASGTRLFVPEGARLVTYQNA